MKNEKVVEVQGELSGKDKREYPGVKKCFHCDVSFEITDKDLEFYEKVSPVFVGKKYLIQSPTICPDCRQQRRLSFRNERKLYKRKCDFSGKDIISIYSPDKPYNVYDQEIWWSDKWDPIDYGRDFDFNRGFFEQFEDFMKEVPHLSILGLNNENSDYGNGIFALKNSYLCFNCDYLENSFFCTNSIYCNNCFDCLGCKKSELLYGCINCIDCYNCFFSINLENCKNCVGNTNCINCEFCINSQNQINKKYLVNNIQVSEKEYQGELEKGNYNYTFGNINKNLTNKNCENILGNYITNSSNSSYCFECENLENVKYGWYLYNVKNSYDYDVFGDNSELINDSIAVGPNGYSINYGCCIWGGSKYMIYNFLCFNCENCFGCIGLRNKSYCILNKQYTKEEYEILVPKIIENMQNNGEWGEFFPSSISPFGYNETVAQEYFPLTKEETFKKGFKYCDYEAPFPKVEKIIKADMLPENIFDIPDDILNWAIECEVTKKPFRIIKQELEFYRKHNLPIPKRHPDQRHLDRMKLRNPRKLFDRKCDKCGKDMKTTYSPEREEIVYCEECYNKEVY